MFMTILFRRAYINTWIVGSDFGVTHSNRDSCAVIKQPQLVMKDGCKKKNMDTKAFKYS